MNTPQEDQRDNELLQGETVTQTIMEETEGEGEEEEDDTTARMEDIKIQDTPGQTSNGAAMDSDEAISKETKEEAGTATTSEHPFNRTRGHFSLPEEDAGAMGFDPATSRGRAPESSTAVPHNDVVRPTNLNHEEQDFEFHELLADSNNSNGGAQNLQVQQQQEDSIRSWWDQDEGDNSAAPGPLGGTQLPHTQHKRNEEKDPKKKKTKVENTVGEETCMEMAVIKMFKGQILDSHSKEQVCRDLKEICASKLTKLREVKIRRTLVLVDAMREYADHTIVYEDLDVTFDGEKGNDIQGLTKEFFHLLMQKFEGKYCDGDTQPGLLLPRVRAADLDDAKTEFFRIGLAIIHGLKLTGLLPQRLAPSVLIKAFTTTEPSESRLVLDFLQVIPREHQCIIVDAVRRRRTLETFSEEALDVFEMYEISAPTPKRLPSALRKAAETMLLIKPAYFINILKASFTTFEGTDLNRLTAMHIECKHEEQKPTPDKVAEIIVTDSRPVDNSSHDRVAQFARQEKGKRVLGWLIEIVRKFSPVLLKKFLRFVTASETMPVDIKVSFIDEQEDSQTLRVSTCGGRLELSVKYESQEDLQLELKTIIQDPEFFKYNKS